MIYGIDIHMWIGICITKLLIISVMIILKTMLSMIMNILMTTRVGIICMYLCIIINIMMSKMTMTMVLISGKCYNMIHNSIG